MARTASTTLLAGVAALAVTILLAIAAGGVAPAQAEAATASSCGISLTPAARSVRRGGKVLLEGEVCGAGTSSAGDISVQVKIEKKKRWATVAKAETDSSGQFAVCARISVPRWAKVARIRATTSSGATARTTLRISASGSSGCDAQAPDSGATGKPPSPPPPPPPPGPGGLSVLREDPGANPDPIPLWNSIDAQTTSRHQHFTTGGPDGGPFRRMTVQDGDNVWGERAELGYNSRMNGLGAPWGTFFLYDEGDRRVTETSMRLPSDFPISQNKWQVVMQMKQTGPSANSGGTPVLALEARGGRWVLTQSDSAGASSNTHELWSTPATLGVWTRISLDVTYSPNPSAGKVQITVGDVASPTFTTYTQKYELSPPGQGLNPGDAIPSHLRMGVYHDPSLPGTHVDFADVRVSG